MSEQDLSPQHEAFCSARGPMPCHICSRKPQDGSADRRLQVALEQWMSPQAVQIWWSSYNQRLGTRPMDAYALGGSVGLVEAAAADVMGDFA